MQKGAKIGSKLSIFILRGEAPGSERRVVKIGEKVMTGRKFFRKGKIQDQDSPRIFELKGKSEKLPMTRKMIRQIGYETLPNRKSAFSIQFNLAYSSKVKK